MIDYFDFQVLSQQAEQARIANQSSSDTTPAEGTTDAPVDAGSFITSLSTPLRQQVLADMDDSMVAVLPTHMAMEAQSLRREREENHRMLVHERLLAQGSSTGARIWGGQGVSCGEGGEEMGGRG